MNQNNSIIQDLTNEASRLLQHEIEIFDEMLNVEGLITEADKSKKQSFDRASTPKAIETLKGESHKLDRLEMVIAIVGTMKAGKSTTINAIVGTEVLPNRNRPMTALPTLIEHTPGQTCPILEFKNQAPIHQLLDEMKTVLSNPKFNKKSEEWCNDDDMHHLMNMILDGEKYQQTYEGPDAIFEFLKGLNDLVRLSNELDLDFPFSDYDEMHEVPVIKVEFAHLRQTQSTNGRVTLLDTPGPNEAGQPHLKKMLKDQLTKASAVLAVLDYTQLKSEADAKVREELQAIASVSQGRLYALVNKFDQKDRNGDDEEKVKEYVSRELMNQALPTDHVFPVSSKLGYLANRALNELHLHKKLPDPYEHAWVEDFANEAFGSRWKKFLDDATEVKEGANELWADSKFDEPLEKVVKKAQDKAAVYAIHSAAAKLTDYAEKIENFLNIREAALTKSTQELQSEIDSLLSDVERMDSAELHANETADKMIKELEKTSASKFKNTQIELGSALDAYFQQGRQLAEEDLTKIKEKEDKENRGGFIYLFKKAMASQKSSNQDFDPNSKIITFYSRDKAEKLLATINNRSSAMLSTAQNYLVESTDKIVKDFNRDFENSVQLTVVEIIQQLESRMQKNGVEITLTLPKTSGLSSGVAGGDLLGDIIKERTESSTRRRRKDNLWGKLCGWFDTDDWGWEEYRVSETTYEVDIAKIKLSINKKLDEIFTGLDTAIANDIRQPIRANISQFFDVVRTRIDELRGDILEGIRSKQGSQDEIEGLKKHLCKSKSNICKVKGDSKDLYSDIQNVFESA